MYKIPIANPSIDKREAKAAYFEERGKDLQKF